MFTTAARGKSSYKNELVKLGEPIGRGAFSWVFSEDESTVIKIGLLRENRAYLDYAKMVVTHGARNPYLPKIYSLTIFQNYDRDPNAYFIARIERLSKAKAPWNHNDITFFVANVSQVFAYDSVIGPDTIHHDPVRHQYLPDLNLILKKLFKKYRCDIRIDNIMLRGNQVVITDPVF